MKISYHPLNKSLQCGGIAGAGAGEVPAAQEAGGGRGGVRPAGRRAPGRHSQPQADHSGRKARHI